MAQIDLKNCDFFLEDGYAGPNQAGGLINNGGGYTSGVTTIAVDGFVGAVVNGDRFTIAGDVDANSDLVVHVVTANTSSPNTTSITFTPATAHSVVDDAVVTILPHQLRVKIGEGNVSWTEKRPVVYVKDRGKLDTVRLGDQDPIEVKMDLLWVFLSTAGGDTIPTPEEVLKHTGLAASWVSSSSDACEPYAVNIVIVYTPPCSVEPETYLLHDFRYEDLGHDLKQGQIAMTGKCNITVVSSTRG